MAEDMKSPSKDTAAAFARALTAFHQGNFALAADLFGRIYKFDPHNREAAANMAVALVQLRRFAEVRAVLRRSGPWQHRPDLQNLSVLAAIQCGALAEAETELHKLDGLDANDIEVINNWGLLRQKQGRLRESFDLFERAAVLSNDHPIALIAWMEVALSLDDEECLKRTIDRVAPVLFRAPVEDPAKTRLRQLQITALTRLRRFNEAEEFVFAVADAMPYPSLRITTRINRLVMEEKFSEAAAVVVKEAPPFLPAAAKSGPAPGAANGTPIQRLVVENSHGLLRHIEAADLSEACGLPVLLADLLSGKAEKFTAAGTLVILTGHTNETEADVLHAIKAAAPECTTVAWLFDNHHSYLANALTAAEADFSFPAHPLASDYLSRIAPGRIGPIVPLATGQWTRQQLANLYKQFDAEERSNDLSGHHAFYAMAHRRNTLLAQAMEQWPQAQITLSNDSPYHAQTPEERFLQWRRFKTSISLPVALDLPIRFFDALAAGQVPIVPGDILDLDRVIPKADQESLPIVRLKDWTVEALRGAHAEAIAAFDREGKAGAARRHHYVLHKHMLAHRIRDILAQTATLRGRV
jgi:hypothetical protein